MTEDTDPYPRQNCSPGSTEQNDPADEWTKDSWESLASDPRDTADLGYRLSDWEQFETSDKTDQVIFLPGDEAQIEDAAFVVAEEATLLDLENHC